MMMRMMIWKGAAVRESICIWSLST
jgi:hypothetical protein